MLSIANMTKMSQAFTLLQKVKQDLKLNPEEITILNTISVSYNNGKITINEAITCASQIITTRQKDKLGVRVRVRVEDEDYVKVELEDEDEETVYYDAVENLLES